MRGKLTELPNSNSEYWEGAETMQLEPMPIKICPVHTKKNFKKGEYKDNGDGTVSCLHCIWGTKLGVNMRIDDKTIVVR